MNIFYNPEQQNSSGGGLAVIPEGCDGGTVIASLISSEKARIMAIDDGDVEGLGCPELARHIELGHCRVDEAGEIYLLAEENWPESQSAEGGEA